MLTGSARLVMILLDGRSCVLGTAFGRCCVATRPDDHETKIVRRGNNL
jgi:hypothetical protein